MSILRLSGIYPPIPTPFENEKIAFDKLELNIEKWCKTGISGIVVLGSNGEYVFLSEEEKRMTVKTVVQTADKEKMIIAGCGCESTKETIRCCEEYAYLGVEAALVITPHYYGGKMSREILINHYTIVAQNSPIPVLIYNVPKHTHINITCDIVEELSQQPNIIGIKESSGNVALIGEVIKKSVAGFNVLVGTAGALFGALALGSVGGILALANIAPDLCVDLYRYVNEGNYKQAKDLQQKLIPVNNAITANYGISGLKAAMDLLGYYGGAPRLPLLPLKNSEVSIIERILREAELM